MKIHVNTCVGTTGRIMSEAELLRVQPTGPNVPKSKRDQRKASKVRCLSGYMHQATVANKRSDAFDTLIDTVLAL